MANLIATSVVRGSSRGESHGGVYLINLETNRILQPVDWNRTDIDWQGHDGGRGLRGIAFHRNKIYIAASDELLVFDQAFNIVASFRNPYLKHCHEVCVFERHLFLTSTGYDSILGFNLETETFDWALKIVTDGRIFGARRFNPDRDDGPLLIDKLYVNNVHCDKGGMYISGLRTGALLRFGGKGVGVMTSLPEGAHNAQPFRGGILFNDTEADAVRFESPDSRKAFRVPRFAPEKLTHTNPEDSRIAHQGFSRGLCVFSESEIAAGSSPSTISIYDLDKEKAVKVVNLSLDARSAIHGIEVWPYEWPDR